MRSTALAIGWEMWGRNRWGILAFGAGWLILCFWANALPQGADHEPVFLLSISVFAVAILYLMSIVLNTEFRTSAMMAGYPSRMFALPVRTRSLVAWPMIYGVAALFTMWGAAKLSLWQPVGEDASWWVPPILAVGLLWFQATCWAVPGNVSIKVVAACIILPLLKYGLELIAYGVMVLPLHIDGKTKFGHWLLATFFVDRNPRQLTIITFSAIFAPLAYLVAVFGVARDRRGSRPNWRPIAWLRDQLVALLLKRTRPFSSAKHAQRWLEFRTKGATFPVFPALLLAFATITIGPFVPDDVPPEGLLFVIGAITFLVLFVAFGLGYGLGKTGFWDNELGLRSWQATRPLSSADLANAKIIAALLSAAATWLFLLLAFPTWVAMLGQFAEIRKLLLPLFPNHSSIGIALIATAGFVGVLVLTWGQIVGALTLTLTGRTWVVNTAVGIYLAIGALLIFVIRRIMLNPDELNAVWTVLGWAAICAVCAKVSAVGWALTALHRQRLLEWRSLGFLIVIWLIGAGCLIAMPYFLLPIDGLDPEAVGIINGIPRRLIAMAAVLALPLVRLIAAPLALRWNRHR